ncbi:MAG: glycosyltransferase family 2 protein [Isosphaeraceae bacterium]
MEITAIESLPIEPVSAEQSSQDTPEVDASAPLISVVVPVRNNPQELRLCLERLFASTYTSYEVIVVDDASTDETAQVAADLGAKVLRLGSRRGPAGARNRGAEMARGEYLFFLDSDVCVHPETLQELHDTFVRDPDLDAAFGSYDTQPTAENVLSAYKNLFHHFVHQDSDERATTFWSGCGAVRRSVFSKMGGFSARYERPSIEDIELGRRLHAAGHRIMLNKRMQVTHLKRWTLWSIIKTDVRDRGVPWTELMLREGSVTNDLNTKVSQRISVVLAYGLLLTFGVAMVRYRHLFWVPIVVFLIISVADYWSIQRRFSTVVRLVAALAALATLMWSIHVFTTWQLVPLGLIIGIIAINFRFYAFFLGKRRLLLLALLLPLHLIYFLYCGLALALGVVFHLWGQHKRAGTDVSKVL